MFTLFLIFVLGSIPSSAFGNDRSHTLSPETSSAETRPEQKPAEKAARNQITDVERAKKLIENLKSNKFSIRRSAEKRLKEIAEASPDAIVPILREAMQSSDPEVRQRVGSVLNSPVIRRNSYLTKIRCGPGPESALAVVDVSRVATEHEPEKCEIRVRVNSLKKAREGDLVSVTLANENLEYMEVIAKKKIWIDEEVSFPLSPQQAKKFTFLSICPFQPEVPFSERKASQCTICALPDDPLSTH